MVHDVDHGLDQGDVEDGVEDDVVDNIQDNMADMDMAYMVYMDSIQGKDYMGDTRMGHTKGRTKCYPMDSK